MAEALRFAMEYSPQVYVTTGVEYSAVGQPLSVAIAGRSGGLRVVNGRATHQVHQIHQVRQCQCINFSVRFLPMLQVRRSVVLMVRIKPE